MESYTERLIGIFATEDEARKGAEELTGAGFTDVHVSTTRVVVMTDQDHANHAIDILDKAGSVNLDHREGDENASGPA